MVSYTGNVKVVDFGVAYAVERASHTRSGTAKGKAAYMSPEQILCIPLDRRSDIFALGTVLWEGVCQRRLFRRENDAATVAQVSGANVVPPRQIRPELPVQLERIILKALARQPVDRFATAGELSREVEIRLR